MIDLRAAAERLRRIKAGDKPDALYGNEPGRELAGGCLTWNPKTLAAHYADEQAVINAYLALVPVDDGEAIDEAWLRQHFQLIHGRGFVVSFHISIFQLLAKDKCEWVAQAGIDVSDDSEHSFSIAVLFTRGDVRRLCKALGVELTG